MLCALLGIAIGPAMPTPIATAAPQATAQRPVDFEFAGNKFFSSGVLQGELDPWLEDLREAPDDEGALSDTSYEVRRFYERAGFPKATVEARREQLPNGRTRITFTVVEGPQRIVRRLTFSGNDQISDDTLRTHFPWDRRGVLSTGSEIFSPESLDAGLAAIKLVYRLSGYLDVDVNATIRETPEQEDVAVEVHVFVKEGEYYQLSHLELEISLPEDPRKVNAARPGVDSTEDSGDASDRESDRSRADSDDSGSADSDTDTDADADDTEPEDDFDERVERARIRAAILDKVGSLSRRAFTPRLPWELAQSAKAKLLEMGYFDATVTPTVIESNAPAPSQNKGVRLVVEPGPIALIGTLQFQGLQRTSLSWLRNRLTFDQGDVFKKSEFDQSRRFLLGTGLFKNVTLEARRDPQNPRQLRVQVTIEEKDAIRTSLQLGWGSYELGRAGLELFHRNLLGRGWEGRLRGKTSFRGEEAELSLRYPFLFDRPLSLRLSSFYRRFEEVSFERQELKGTAALEFPWDSPIGLLRVSTGYQVREEQVHDPDVLALVEVTDDTRAALLFADTTYDTRDSILNPTRGRRWTLRTEYASPGFGSELSFLRLDGGASWIWSPVEHWVWVASLRSGWIRSLDSKEIPITERFFLGGSRSIRAFTRDDVGPKDAGSDPIGGEAFVVANIENRFPIWRFLHGSMFFDIGSLVERNEDWADRDYRYGPGAGLFLNTPIGPLRLDAAVNIDRQKGEDEWVFHLLLGHPF